MKNEFHFKGYSVNYSRGIASFYYQLFRDNKSINFEEQLIFPKVSTLIPQQIEKIIFESILIILGISYWKTYCPNIILDSIALTKEQANFWNVVYTKGLGEFFYKNKINYHNLVSFPYSEIKKNSFPLRQKNRALVPIGGGKDSIVTAELLQDQKKDFEILFINNSVIQKAVAKKMNKNPIIIKREIDNKLFLLNREKGVYNGHIPISVIYAFLGVFAAILYDFNEVIVSNEKSANYGNIDYLGQQINHQWSKSQEFEKMMQNYITSFITPDIKYYSMLRQFSEIEVTKMFVKYPKYFSVFSSCNTNFKITKNTNKKWCRECPKCIFVFTMLSAYLKKEELIGIFGKNLYAQKNLEEQFKKLLGILDFKPFECVGEPIEMQFAMFKAYQRGEYDKDFIMQMFAQNVLPHIDKENVLERKLFLQRKSSLS